MAKETLWHRNQSVFQMDDYISYWSFRDFHCLPMWSNHWGLVSRMFPDVSRIRRLSAEQELVIRGGRLALLQMRRVADSHRMLLKPAWNIFASSRVNFWWKSLPRFTAQKTKMGTFKDFFIFDQSPRFTRFKRFSIDPKGAAFVVQSSPAN